MISDPNKITLNSFGLQRLDEEVHDNPGVEGSTFLQMNETFVTELIRENNRWRILTREIGQTYVIQVQYSKDYLS